MRFHAGGTVARLVNRPAVVAGLFACATLLALTALAAAAPTAFGARAVVGSVGTAGSLGGQFSTPRGIAVNQNGAGGVPAGTFYVTDASNNRVQQFAPDGSFVRTWGWGVRDGSNEFQICSKAEGCRYGNSGTGAGQVTGPQGVAVDPATGSVFVANEGARRVDVFTAAGLFQGGFGWGVLDGSDALQFCTTLTGCEGGIEAPESGPIGGGQLGLWIGDLAIGPAGDVYVAERSTRRVSVFKPLLSGGVVTGAEFVRSFGWGAATGADAFEVCEAATCSPPAAAGEGLGQFGENSPTDVAVDSAGNVYALDAGNNRVQKFGPAPAPLADDFGGAAIAEAFESGSLHALALDPDTENLLVAGSRGFWGPVAVLELDETGTKVELAGTDLTTSSANGIAASKGSLGGNVFVSSSEGAHRVYVLGLPATIEPVTAVGATSATLNGTVVSEGSDVAYRFEYSTDGANWASVPASDATVPAQPGSVAVQQEATGLQPNTKYMARLVASRPPGGFPGTTAIVEFETAGAAPTVEGQLASQVTPSSARLAAYLNPNNDETTYRFEYGTTPAYGSSVPLPEGSAGSGSSQVAVSAAISGLQPDTTYHYRVVATNSAGSSAGSDATFTTRAAGAMPAVRAFELITPTDKGGNEPFVDPVEPFPTPLISADGDTSLYGSFGAIKGADPVSNGVVNHYRARRTAAGWENEQLGTVMDPASMTLGTIYYTVFSEDFELGVQQGPLGPPVTPDASDGSPNLYLTDGSSFRLITEGMPPQEPFIIAEALGGSDDLSHVVFYTSGFDPTGEAPAGTSPLLFDWDAASGETKLVGRLPGGEPSPGPVFLASSPGFVNAASVNRNPVSADGSRIFFYTPTEPGERQLYVRIDGEETKHVSESQRTVPDPNGTKPATFQIASDDGSVVYFTSSEKLTDDATTGPSGEGNDLYRYDVDSGELTDLTVDATDPNGAEVGGVLGASADGSRLYFVAKGVLDDGATAGANNLYRWTDDGSPAGEIQFIVSGVDHPNWRPDGLSAFKGRIASRVTADGEHLLFHSNAPISGYPNAGHYMAYVYDAGSGEITCATCNPDGSTATTNAFAVGAGENMHHARSLTQDGRRVFFSTAEQLVGSDVNAVEDVYEYDGALGEIRLLSAGTGAHNSRFSDATPDGGSVVFVTRDRLVGIDRDNDYDAYDARVGGGIPSQNPPPAPPPCLGENCRGAAAALPPLPVPGSSTVDGPGDAKPKHKKAKKQKNCRKLKNAKQRKKCFKQKKRQQRRGGRNGGR